MKKKILILSLLCLFALAVCCACDKKADHEHVYGDWSVSVPATCMQDGKEKATCTICGEGTERKIKKKEHDFSLSPETVIEASCQSEGETHIGCSYGCGTFKTVYTSKTDHDFRGEETVIEPTCTQKGERKVKCLHCDEKKTTVLSALKHSYDEGKVEREATCEEDGLLIYTCTRCPDKKEEKIDRLGHKFGDFVVDKPSSINEDGEKSRHCIHEGCEERSDVTFLPKGKNVAFTVRAVRECGDYSFTSELKVQLQNDKGEEVFSYTFKNGVASFTIEFQPLKVVLVGLRKGYVQQEFPELSRSEVDLKVKLKASLIENKDEKAPSKRLTAGDVMYDFAVRDIDTKQGEEKKFSELLQGKKGAYLFFFYIGCGNCAAQFPVFLKEREEFKAENDLLVIMVNVYSSSTSGQTAEDMRKYRAQKGYPDSVLMMSGVLSSGSNLYDWTDRTYNGVPYSFFIDRDGVIDEIVPADSQEGLKARYERILPRLLGREKEETSSKAQEFIFIEKRRPEARFCKE